MGDVVFHGVIAADPNVSVRHFDKEGRPLDAEGRPLAEGPHQTIGEVTEIRKGGAPPVDTSSRVERLDTTAGDVAIDNRARGIVEPPGAAPVGPGNPLGTGGDVERDRPAPPPGGAVTALRSTSAVEVRDTSRGPAALPPRPPVAPPVTGPVPTGDGRTTVTQHGLDPMFKGDPTRDPEAYAAELARQSAAMVPPPLPEHMRTALDASAIRQASRRPYTAPELVPLASPEGQRRMAEAGPLPPPAGPSVVPAEADAASNVATLLDALTPAELAELRARLPAYEAKS